MFENNRAPFEWRVGSGPWTLNSAKEQPATNVQELAFWNPIGWTRLGTAQLTVGDHTLEIRLARQPRDPAEPSKGFAELRYASDCIHITTT